MFCSRLLVLLLLVVTPNLPVIRSQIAFPTSDRQRFPNRQPSINVIPSSKPTPPPSAPGPQTVNTQYSLKDFLGSDAPSVKPRINFGGVNVRRQGDQCFTPLNEAGTCQYIFSRQCRPILNIILQQGVTNTLLQYLFQAIRSPCGFEGFDFTLCCADQKAPIIEVTTAGPAPCNGPRCAITAGPVTPAPTPSTAPPPTPPPPPPPTTTTQSPVVERCGQANNNRIVGGQEARPGDWPWAVILGRGRGGGGIQVQCGGTLLNEDTVLTAAHCFDIVPGRPGPNIVRLGDHDISTSSDGVTGVDISILRSIQHPGWNSDTLNNDIAVVKLAQRVTFTRSIKAACLPDAYRGRDLPSSLLNPNPVIIGWGSTFTGGGPETRLREARVPITTQASCARAYSAIPRVTIGDTKLCAGDGTRDTCNGDSGGGLLANNLSPGYAVVGVTSFGVDCARPDFPGVYTRVDQYLPWIRSHF